MFVSLYMFIVNEHMCLALQITLHFGLEEVDTL